MRPVPPPLRFVAAALVPLLLACSAGPRPATQAAKAARAVDAQTTADVERPDAKKEITGYGPFDFTRTATAQAVEEAGGNRLQPLAPGQLYVLTPYERFDGLVDFLPYYRKGRVPPARQGGNAPKINAGELRLEDGRLWLIILYFNPNDYDDYLRVITFEYGEPTVPSRKGADLLRKDLWFKGERCITLEQVVLTNTMNGGQLAVQKGRCEERQRRK